MRLFYRTNKLFQGMQKITIGGLKSIIFIGTKIDAQINLQVATKKSDILTSSPKKGKRKEKERKRKKKRSICWYQLGRWVDNWILKNIWIGLLDTAASLNANESCGVGEIACSIGMLGRILREDGWLAGWLAGCPTKMDTFLVNLNIFPSTCNMDLLIALKIPSFQSMTPWQFCFIHL